MDPTHHRFWTKVLKLNINTEVLNTLNWPTPLSTILLNTTPKFQSLPSDIPSGYFYTSEEERFSPPTYE